MKYSSSNLDFEVYVHLHDLHKILSKYQRDSAFDEKMNRHLELIRTKRYRVAVLGEFSRGKSSLINAMLGSAILPADILPATATINRVTFGLDSYVEIVYKSGEREQIAIDELEQYVTKLTGDSEKKASSIEEAVIYYPTVICQNHIDIIDTPGLNESEDMTFLTRSQLSKIDAAIVTISALTPLSQTEKELILSLLESDEIGYLVFVVSFIDKLDEEDVEKVLEHIRKQIQNLAAVLEEKHGADSEIAAKAHHILDAPEAYGLSARKALKAFETNNSRLLQESRFPDFQKALYRILTKQQNVNAIYKTLRMMLGTGEQLGEWYQQRLAEREEKLRQIQEAYRGLEDFCHGEQAMLQQMMNKRLPALRDLQDTTSLRELYRVGCVEALSSVLADEEGAIEVALQECDLKVNQLTSRHLNTTLETIKLALLPCLQEFGEEREQKLCQILARADGETAEALSHRMQQYMDKISEQQVYVPAPFVYRKPNLVQPRHCNYIADLERQFRSYLVEVNGCITRMYEHISLYGAKTAAEDAEDKQKIFEIYRQYIHNEMTDKLLYEREYVKHQEELQEIFTFCEELLAEIMQ